MHNNINFLTIIPARGGSKRVPGKNIKLLHDKPLIAWTIEAALNCHHLNRVIVSTDDNNIAKIAIEYGAEVPFIRPALLAQDNSTTVDMVKHALKFYSSNQETFDYVVLLQPTSPLRNSEHITEAIELLLKKKADAIISVCKVEHSPLWTNIIPKNGSLKSFINDDVKNVRSQDLDDYYRLNGAIYIVNVKRLFEENTLFLSENIFSYEMDTINSVDIDENIDFLYTEFLLKHKNLSL